MYFKMVYFKMAYQHIFILKEKNYRNPWSEYFGAFPI